MDARASSISAILQQFELVGERILLLLDPGVDYILAYLGCLYAGAVAVPAYPPDTTRLERTLPRIQAIARDADVKAAIVSKAFLARQDELVAVMPELGDIVWLTVDVPASGEQWVNPDLSATSLAFLQYTSGSTGLPKGVKVLHGNLLHNVSAMQQRMGQDEQCEMVSWVPPYHDMGLVVGILLPLYAGFPTNVMAPTTFVRNPFRWLEAISRYRATASCAPNFAFDLCLRKVSEEQKRCLDLSRWSLALDGAEPVRSKTIDQFTEAFSGCGFRRETFYPAFGMSDATAMVSGTDLLAGPLVVQADVESLKQGRYSPATESASSQLLVGCGRVIDGQQLKIVDPERMSEVPPGHVGEVWLKGGSVGGGYWNRPDESREVFGATLADGDGPWLRTGDLGFLVQQDVVITGRLKDLIIIRGRNHYPQDIELTVQNSNPALRPGCGIAFSVEVDGVEQLAIVQEIDERAGVDVDAVLDGILSAVATEHEVAPHAIVLIATGTLPKTSSGKLQRRLCRQLFLENKLVVVEQRRSGLEPREPPAMSSRHFRFGMERAQISTYPADKQRRIIIASLLGHVASIVRVDPVKIDPDKPLSRLGFDSLTAIELKNRIELAYRVALPMVDILKGPSLKDLSQYVFAQMSVEQAPLNSIAPSSSQEQPVFSLSFGQQALWFIRQLAPLSAAYNVVLPVRIRGALSVDALSATFQQIVSRHSSLRTTFSSESGTPFQEVFPRVDQAFNRIDASTWTAFSLRSFLADESHRPFDLERGPLFRVHCVRRRDDEHILLIVAHHSIIDFWSFGLIFRDLGEIYPRALAGQPLGDGNEPVRYSDYVAWQRRTLAGPEGERLWSYWRQQLAGELPVLELPTDRPRPPNQTYLGASRSFRLGPHLTRQIKDLAAAHDCTVFTTLLAAFQILLHRLSGQDDVLVGALTAGRSRAEFADLVGYFVNPIVLRARFTPGLSFSEFLRQMRQIVLEGLAYSDFPFSVLVERLLLPRDASRSPLFQSLFVLQKAPVLDAQGLTAFALQEEGARMALGGLNIESMPVEQRIARFDLTLTMADTETGLGGSLEYNVDLFDEATIERTAEQFVCLLHSIVEVPTGPVGTLRLLPPAQRDFLLSTLNQTSLAFPEQSSVHALFEQQARQNPEKVAVTYEGGSLTFAELDERASRLASFLRQQGVERDVPVGLCLERSLDLAVGLLGILKAGGAYIPLDPAYPRDRLAFMMADAQSPLLVTQTSLVDHVATTARKVLIDEHWPRIAQTPIAHLPPVDARSLCYVIYTSGSTGRPKGVMIEHRSVVNFLVSMQQEPGLSAADVLLSVTSASFDIFGLEFYLPLLVGARVILASRSLVSDGRRLVEEIHRHGVTTVQATPSSWQMMLDSELSLPRNLRVLCGGEALSAQLAERLLLQVPVVWNMYGPTETTIWSTCSAVERRDDIVIGKPIQNTSVYLLDEHLQPVPLGAHGECYIGGDGVARGYLHRPELTAERFVPDPFSNLPGARMYRTGDRMRWHRDGKLEYLGRVDFQVKFRGFRIELGEIESRLQDLGAIKQAVVLLRADGGVSRLVAYLVLSEPMPSASALQELLRHHLPEYMIPSVFVPVEAMPQTPNGKIDRKALPAPALGHLAGDQALPSSPTAERLVALWSRVLGVPQVGSLDNFFELGGHSLLVMRLIALIKREFAVELPVHAIFEAPTLELQARQIERLVLGHKTSSDTVDFEAEIQLDDSLEAAGRPVPSIDASSPLLFTGGTGFLGAFLLQELLKRTTGPLYCLVRASSVAAGLERLRKNLERFHVQAEQGWERVVPVLGDLALPRMGLSDADYSRLASEISWVLHNGAMVDFVKPYSSLRGGNVDGTREALRFACRGRLKQFHLVSTVSVFPPQDGGPKRRELESDPLSFDAGRLHGGYAQSKWVSDRIAMVARARGIPVTIFRPGSILGPSHSGHGNVDDIFHLIMKGCIQCGMVPDVDMWANFTPSDYVAPAIVQLALDRSAQGGTFHMVNPTPVPWSVLCDKMREVGYQVRWVPYETWLAALELAAERMEDNALVRVLPFFQVPRETFCLPWFDDAAARQHLQESGTRCAPADDAYLTMWLRHLIVSGFLPPPPNSPIPAL
jgi:amino acid adenylation domain-containing protein/thioester reductase-like protein